MNQVIQLSSSIKLPVDIGTETIAVLGRRGSGKSNTATVMMEELITAGQQVVLIDPKGEGWGLKAQGAGSSGLDVIVFGEPEGHLPLREGHGETIADFVVSSGRSCVLSLAGLDADAAARRFVARFAERLFTLKKKPENHSPLMLVLEEAHLFVPQRVEGAQSDVVSRLQRLVRQGRSMGLGVALVDQRPASVNKDVLTQIELMICHQLTSPHDRKAVDAWIEANAEPEQAAEFRRSLPTLEPGEAWIWSPAKLKLFTRAKIRRRSTFDSGSTPVLGKDAAKRPKMREVNLDDVRKQLEEVEEVRKANDPAELKKRVRELEAELATKRRSDAVTKPDPARDAKIVNDAKSVVLRGLSPLLQNFKKGSDHLSRKAAELADLIASHHAVLKSFETFVETMASAKVVPTANPLEGHNPGAAAAVSRHTTKPVAPAVGARKVGSVGEGLSRPQQRILDGVAWWNAIGVDAPSRLQVGFVAGIKPTGGHFSNSIGPLGTRGLIENVGDGVKLTEAGTELANLPPVTPTLAEYHNLLRSVIRNGATRRILDVIIEAGYDALTVELIGEKTGINAGGGHFSNSIGPLSTLGLIERRAGVVHTTKLLFPEDLK